MLEFLKTKYYPEDCGIFDWFYNNIVIPVKCLLQISQFWSWLILETRLVPLCSVYSLVLQSAIGCNSKTKQKSS